VAANAQEPYFPDLVFHPADKEDNAFVDDITSAQLRALNEPSLWKKSQTDREATVYRFLWLGTSEHPTCVRITRVGDVATMHISRHNQHPGNLNQTEVHPKVIVDREIKLTLKQWDDIVDRLESVKFWSAPTDIKVMIADGDRLLIEGIKDGKYHVVDRHRSITKEDYEPLFRMVLEIAGPDFVESWSDFSKRSYARELLKQKQAK
jgi:hypothetical protein